MEYAGDGSKWGVHIDYSHEESPLGTIGPLTLIPDLPDYFLTINGDTLTDLNYKSFLLEHIEKKRRLSVAVKKREAKTDFGVLLLNNKNELVDFKEKPTHITHVAMGVNCFSREVIEQLPHAAPYGFDDLMRDSLAKHEQVSIYEYDGFWLDVGRPEDYRYAVENFDDIKKKLQK